ncbi:MAG: bifunctional helix-turn-helix transcriptional regulator/GNAT family N-acetyltransferase [Paracoccaceae bacterium]|nr:MAG: bifunctional helix-turn-helix transcriptional regulator/GNAT family N-acetyltransferase [Paracoccaceae bacterium]
MDTIDRIRAFNRFYTGHLGLLGRSYLGSGLGVTEVRILHDLQGEGPVRARELARSLGIDEAFLSRVLRGFETRGWIMRSTNPQDARQRDVVLTDAGRSRLQDLQARSRAAVAQVLSPLPPEAQDAVAEALTQVRTHLTATRDAAELADLRPGDAGWVIARHAVLYAEDEGYDASFEGLVADIVARFLNSHDPSRERGWIAWRGGVRVGAIFCMAEGADEADCARLRLFFVEHSERGTGLAQRMIEECLRFARGAGYARMRLWTHESHRAAGRLYDRNGFGLVSSAAAHAFGQDVVEQVWERPL